MQIPEEGEDWLDMSTWEDREKLVKILEKYDLYQFPVGNKILIGITKFLIEMVPEKIWKECDKVWELSEPETGVG